MPNGFLLIDKPAGLRSTDCVSHIKRLSGKGSRAGHAGALDSTASGLLVVLLGAATRLSDYVMKMPKIYEADIRLGAATDTCDASGAVIFRGDASRASAEELDRVLFSFLGTRMQRPPEISALKVGGKPSHKLARKGLAPGLSPRPVTMASVKRLSPVSDGAVKISVLCGKGTYIRALARDIGEALGCGAHVEALRRLSVGPFSVNEAYAPDGLSDITAKLRSVREVGSVFHRVVLTREAEKNLSRGLCVPLAGAGRYIPGSAALSGLELRREICVEGAEITGFADLILDGNAALVLKPRVNIAADEAGAFE